MKKVLFSMAICLAASSMFFSCGGDDDGGGGNTGNPSTGTFTDTRDNTTYKTVTIGSQTWMAENLNYQGTVSEGTISCYNNTQANCDTLGAMYDFESAQDACPTGWHLPSDAEWKTLEMALGMTEQQADSIALRAPGTGTKLKEGGSSGMDLRLGGDFQFDCQCYANIGRYGTYWTSTPASDTTGFTRYVTNSTMFQADPTRTGRGRSRKSERVSVRCVKTN